MDISQARKKKLSDARRKTTVITVALLLALFIAGMLYITLAFFGLENINIYGTELYSEGQVMSAANLSGKTNLFYLSSGKLASQLESKFAYIETAKIEKKFPHTLNIYASMAQQKYIAEADGQYYILSEKLKVLEKAERVTDELVFLVYGCENEQKPGTAFKFNSSADKDIFETITATLKSAEIFDAVTEIDFADKLNISVTYDGRIRIEFSDYKEIDKKIAFAAKIVLEKDESAKGTLYVPTTEKAVFDPDR